MQIHTICEYNPISIGKEWFSFRHTNGQNMVDTYKKPLISDLKKGEKYSTNSMLYFIKVLFLELFVVKPIGLEKY